MELMKLKEAILQLKYLLVLSEVRTAYKSQLDIALDRRVDALQTAISCLETLQRVGEVSEVKKKEYISPRDYKNEAENNQIKGFNKALDAVHAELAGKLERIEEIIKDKISNIPIKGDFDATRVLYLNEGAIKGLTKAIQEFILGKREEVEMETDIKEVSINDKVYVLKSSKQTEIVGDIKIVVLQRGWIVVGMFEREVNGTQCKLHNAYVIRVWGTTQGLGEIASGGPTPSTKLDKCYGIVQFDYLTVVLTIDCDSKKWNSTL